MRQLVVLAKNAFKLCLRNKFVLFSMIVFPVLSTFLILLDSGSGLSSAETNVIYYSESNDVYSQTILSSLKENSLFELTDAKLFEGESLGVSFAKGSNDLPEQFKKISYSTNVNIFLYLPSDVGSRIKSGDGSAVVVYDTGNDQKSYVLKSTMSQILSRIKTFETLSGGDESKLREMLAGAHSENLKGATVSAQTQNNTGNSDQGGKFSLVMGFFSWFAIWGSSFAVTMILKERHFKVYKRILLTNTSSAKYLASKFLVGAAIGVIQVALMVLSFRFVVRADYVVHWWQLALLLFGFILIAITINLAIVSFCTSESQITYASIIVVNVTAMISGGYWPLELVPTWMQNLSYLMPQRWIPYTISRISANVPYAMAEYGLVVLGFMAFFSSVALIGFKFRSRLDA